MDDMGMPPPEGRVVESTRDPPDVFVRTFATPPGLPWDQRRNAELEARHGAPLPINDVAYQLRRLEPWRPGGTARYAALYVRAAQFSRTFTATVDAEGHSLQVRFVHPRERGERSVRTLQLAGASALVALFVVGTIALAVGDRAARTSQLEALETLATGKARAAQIIENRASEARTLARTAEADLTIADLVAAISWVSVNKAPDSTIEAFHWERGASVVEVKGEGPPFTDLDRTVVKSEKPVRRGVWAWGIASAGREQAAPVSAELRGDVRR